MNKTVELVRVEPLEQPSERRTTPALLSRSGETHFLGPCDDELAVAMPSEMKADLRAMGALLIPPRSASELARMVLSDWMYGRKAQVQRIVGQ